MRLAIALCALMACLGVEASGQTNVASSPCPGDVQAAVDTTIDGGCVLVPDGTCWWSTNVYLTRSVSVVATGSVTIVDNLPPGLSAFQQNLFYLNTLSNQNYRISGFAFLPGTNRTSVYTHGAIAAYGYGTVRIDHNSFTHLLQNHIYIDDFVHGPVDHNSHMIGAHVHSVSINGQRWGGTNYDNGDKSWASPPNYGSPDMPILEDNVYDCDILNIGNTAHIDCFAGARFAARHETVKNGFFTTHGRESGQRFTSPRQYEIYNCAFSIVPALVGTTPYAFNSRGGSGVLASNTVSGFKHAFGLALYRGHHAFPNHWGGADGLNAWDTNSATLYANPVHTGTNGSAFLVSAGAAWTTNQWQGYTLVSTNAPVSTNLSTSTQFVNHQFGEILSNSTDTIWVDNDGTAIGGPSQDCTLSMTNGIAYQARLTYQIVDMPGAGSGDLLTGNSGENPVWLNQVIEGVYASSNTWADGSAAIVGANQTTQIVENKHFFNGTPKPGWVPYTYPDPRTGNTNGPSGSPPDITTQPQSMTNTVNTIASFTVSASGTAPLLYQWQLSSTNIVGATASIYITPTLTIGYNGAQYRVIVTNNFGSATSQVATLTVIPLPAEHIHIIANGQVNISGQINAGL